MAPDLSSQMVEYAERTVDDILEVCRPPLPTEIVMFTITGSSFDRHVLRCAALCCAVLRCAALCFARHFHAWVCFLYLMRCLLKAKQHVTLSNSKVCSSPTHPDTTL